MISRCSGKIVLLRGDDVVSESPSVDEVLSLMKEMGADRDKEGAPELTLRFVNRDGSKDQEMPILFLLRAFHRQLKSRWIVDLSSPQIRESKLLVSRLPVGDRFEVWTCCGVISQYRSECVINDYSLIERAIEWFLRHHSPCPQLLWRNYDDCVRDEDNSLYES